MPVPPKKPLAKTVYALPDSNLIPVKGNATVVVPATLTSILYVPASTGENTFWDVENCLLNDLFKKSDGPSLTATSTAGAFGDK